MASEAAGGAMPQEEPDAVAAPGYDLGAWRSEIPLLASTVPMNACSHAPQTTRTRAAAREYLDLWNRRGMDWDAWMAKVDDARASFARLVGATPEEVAVTTSVSAAANGVASALDYGQGRDRIVVSGAEFPSVAHIWTAQERRGAVVDRVPVRDGTVRMEDYQTAVDGRTRLVSASHAFYRNGFLQDVAGIVDIAHDAGAMVFVDAYQSLGTRPVDVGELGVDVLASGALKYLMGIPGIAFLYVRSGLIDELEPVVTGWFGRRDPFAFDDETLDFHPTARRFETGTPPILEAYVCLAGLDIIHEVGPERIRRWGEVLTRRMIERGRERGLAVDGTTDPARKTPSTAFVVPGGDAADVQAELRERGILGAARSGCVRLAPHFYNTLDEVDRAVDELADIVVG